jgi:hypothetical protein
MNEPQTSAPPNECPAKEYSAEKCIANECTAGEWFVAQCDTVRALKFSTPRASYKKLYNNKLELNQ